MLHHHLPIITETVVQDRRDAARLLLLPEHYAVLARALQAFISDLSAVATSTLSPH